MLGIEEVLAKHLAWLNNEDEGERANLHRANLSEANLSEADLRGANLSGADLSGADLYGANLYGANLYGAKLSGAKFYGVDLSGANLRSANLFGANLFGANLFRANLFRANLTGADLTGAKINNAIGNGKEIINLPGLKWNVVMTANAIAIGCQQHTSKEWATFDDTAINRMNREALSWWKKHKELVLTTYQKHFLSNLNPTQA